MREDVPGTPAFAGLVKRQIRPQRTEWREIADALSREYGHPYISNGEPRRDFSRHVYVGRAGALLLKAERQEAEIEQLRAAATEVIEFNRQHAFDKYGDATKAESWACVKTLRAALALKQGIDLGA